MSTVLKNTIGSASNLGDVSFPPKLLAASFAGAAPVLTQIRQLARTCVDELAKHGHAELNPSSLCAASEQKKNASILTLFRRAALISSGKASFPDVRASSWITQFQQQLKMLTSQLEGCQKHPQHVLLNAYASTLQTHWAAGAPSLRTNQIRVFVLDVHPSALLAQTEPRLAFAHPMYALAQWLNDCYGSPIWPRILETLPRLSLTQRRLLHVFALFLTWRQTVVRQTACDTTCAHLPCAVSFAGVDDLSLCTWHVQMLGQVGRKFQPFFPDLLVHRLQAKTGWKAKKSGGFDDRSEPLEATLARIEPVMHLAGITRVPDITGLDNTGVPAFQCVRPDAQWGSQTFTVFGGKGESALQCRISAIAEGIERFCAEDRNHRDRIVCASYRELVRRHAVIHPRLFNVPPSLIFSEDETLEWMKAHRLDDNTSCYVPACTVFYPYEPQTGRTLMRYFTTGLAAGNDRLEALSHGLAEVIERDGAALNRIVRRFPAIDLGTINSQRAQQLIQRFHNASLNIFIRLVSAPDIGIPVFSVILEDQLHPNPLYVSGGYGAHPDKEVALINALTEAGLSRSSTISGAREDLIKFKNAHEGLSYENFRKRYHYWFTTEPAVDYRELISYRLPTVTDDLCLMAKQVRAAGLPDLLWVDLGKPELQLSVVKVLVPGIERYSFKLTCIGQRARNLYFKHYNRPLQA
ncbi:YcaO-like family protein [Verminephrobacter aporrectodeae]|uniref:YcaO domain-containing protein n=1 Tax=Verminephrobacter aporrectodeae subsp. tuberculatae TaxID=1110392 RepID=A0ABT3KXY8_9BURK|nr:YcaO-like family protein [Verminephrobacter aporrectodeae]MCW5256433.1 hypothetical protein [Verminephrobacter aporrectodeae subsp. tuberculatae]MCW5323204.1 hypothetical protein [Verminephrobacter aporrectodeae subsp. tuberculatae]MCW8177269.1 hypothetical protein [Verminephrobacter aporrectodeae subsp. tuberculatae]MCW8200342.1 hypothetical protein [Verminephrobacter aporrectodeae subsp. tuberculatae]MCW8204697.1 hypothetical protein [Verminephrobacter aporrectodeae subsp. tuberculatae]